jgi:hypothetical protein
MAHAAATALLLRVGDYGLLGRSVGGQQRHIGALLFRSVVEKWTASVREPSEPTDQLTSAAFGDLGNEHEYESR